MSNMEEFKRVKSINYRGSIVAMIMTQALIFTFELSVIANIAAYIINFVAWIVFGAVLEAVAATYYGIDLSKKGNKA